MRPTVESSVVGTMTQYEGFEDLWEGGSVPVPFFSGQPLPVTYLDFIPSEDPTFLAEADVALATFLQKGPAERAAVTAPVYDNYLEDLDSWELEPLDVPTPGAVWAHVFPRELLLKRRPSNDRDVYLTVACECAWEVEHGLQLVYRRGEKLTRVSQQDGWLTEADARDLPDDEDPLLSQF